MKRASLARLGRSCCLAAGFVLALGTSDGHADEAQEREFIRMEANARVSTAQTPQDFSAAGDVFLQLVDRGVRNGGLFYDLGTTLLMAGRYEESLFFLRRAERYQGSDADTRRNLILAIRGASGDASATLPWYRVPLFWHYDLSCPTRTTLAVVAFAVFWLARTAHRLKRRPVFRLLVAAGFSGVVIFGSSVVASILLESQDRARRDLAPIETRVEPEPAKPVRTPDHDAALPIP